MTETVSYDDELYKELASYGNKDESHNTILARILKHLDEEAAQEDRLNRTTTWEGQEEEQSGNPHVEALEDGTEVRYRIERGDYAGEERTGVVQGGRVEYDRGDWSPSGFAREADQDIRGSDARQSESYNGSREVEYENEDGELVPIETVQE